MTSPRPTQEARYWVKAAELQSALHALREEARGLEVDSLFEAAEASLGDLCAGLVEIEEGE